MPVKLPGPIPTTRASRSAVRAPAWRKSASTSCSSVTAREIRSPRTSPSSTSALVATSVAVSKARISIHVHRDKSQILAAVLQADPARAPAARRPPPLRAIRRTRPRPRSTARGRPTPPSDTRRETEEIEMGDVDSAAIAMADREGRARDPVLHAERAARAADKRRLAGRRARPRRSRRRRPRARRQASLRAPRSRPESATRSEQAELHGRLGDGGRDERGLGAAAALAAHQLGQAQEVRLAAPRACAACRARPRDGRSDRGALAYPPSVVSCSWPCTRVMPVRPSGEELGREVPERRDHPSAGSARSAARDGSRRPRSPRG